MDTSITRNSYFDNAKLALIFLVVFGHILEVFKNHEYYRTAYTFIYSFHMPMFCLISGYFSKADQSSTDIKKQISILLIPFLIFQIIYSLSLDIFKGAPIYALLVPHWHLWFILSLFYWRVSIPYINNVKYLIIFIVIISVVFGCLETPLLYFLGIGVTINYLPFFLFGYFLPKHFYIELTSYRYRVVSLVILIAALLLFHSYIGSVDYHLFKMIPYYRHVGYVGFNCVFLRILAYAASLLLGLSFLSLIPGSNIRLTTLGRNTLSVYLWHGIVLYILYWSGVLDFIFNEGQFFFVPLSFTLIAILITFSLSSNLFVKYSDFFINGFRLLILRAPKQ